MQKMIVVNVIDNVATAVEKLDKGQKITFEDSKGTEHSIIAKNDIPIYHKIAIKMIPANEPIIKYGEHIGIADDIIESGEHVHIHNVVSRREDLRNK